MSPPDRVALHEAAHAVAHIALNHELTETSIKRQFDGKLGYTKGNVLPDGLVESNDWGDGVASNEQRQAARDDIVILLSGEAAEAFIDGEEYEPEMGAHTCSDELEAFNRIARLERDHVAQDALLRDLLGQASDLVADYWSIIGRVATALTEKETLTGKEVSDLVSDREREQ